MPWLTEFWPAGGQFPNPHRYEEHDMSGTRGIPSVPRMVRFFPPVPEDTRPEDRPHQAALICYVHNEGLVNLSVCDENGLWSSKTSVTFGAGNAQGNNAYADWAV